MSYILKIALSLGGLLLVWGGGFILFYIYVNRLSPPDICEPTDGIVVLTGGRGRVQMGLDLLQKGCGKALLISGVSAGKEDVISPREDSSRVTFGYKARDTIGNAQEIAQWVQENTYKTLLVVTSDYHMARALMELQAAVPQIRCIAYPVKFLSKGRFSLIFQEYNKFIYTFFRINISNIQK